MPQLDHPNPPVRTTVWRSAIALVSWGFAGLAILGSVMMPYFEFVEKSEPISIVTASMSVAPLIAWIALAEMTLRWLRGRHSHRAWPVIGAISGLFSAAMFLMAFFTYISAVPLAIYLTWWHFTRSTKGLPDRQKA